ncbi:MAG: Gfo/Idh/MocA family protein, partial [Polyangiaceae bacterium]
MKRTRVGIVGFGVMGARHARVFGALDSDFEIAGALDPNGSQIPSFLRHFMRLEDLVDACDLVVVSNPIEAHAATVMRSLDRGRHVLVEKPIAATARAAKGLVDRAEAATGNLFVGHSERFHPVVRSLVRELHGQRIRTIHFRRIANGAPRDASLRTR